MGKYLYLYRMSSDSGNAPCPYEEGFKKSNLLSLACCKGGGVRNHKPIKSGLRRCIGEKHMESLGVDEVWIAALYQGKLLYAAKLDSIIPMYDYFHNDKYHNRMDQIYDVRCEESFKLDDGVRKLKRNNRNPHFHGKKDSDQHLRDELGLYVLLSSEFMYLGKEPGPIEVDEAILSMFPSTRGSSCYDESSPDLEKFMSFVVQTSYWGKGCVANSPHEELSPGCKAGCQK